MIRFFINRKYSIEGVYKERNEKGRKNLKTNSDRKKLKKKDAF